MKFLPPRACGLTVLSCVAVILAGCDEECDELRGEISDRKNELATLKLIEELKTPAPAPGGASTRLEAAAASTREKRLALKSINDVQASFFSFPNKSFGKFTAQVTVACNSLTGLVDGESRALLEFRQPTLKPTPRRLHIGAVYDAMANGLRAEVRDLDGMNFGTPVPLAGTFEVDLRVEQTDTQLIFSARPTPDDQSAGGWMPVYTLDAPPEPAAFHVYIGKRQVKKGGTFYFTHFALDGEGIGGSVEYPIIAGLRGAIEAVRSAQAKIKAPTPDLAGALADFDTAIAAHDAALTNLLTDLGSLQNLFLGRRARKTLEAQAKSFTAARAALATQDIRKAKPQLAKLDAIATAELSAITNLLGWAGTNLKTAPDLFSLRIP